jgi:GR25 family glycosyltransferase involved in LPS biosynthesis
MKLTDFDKIQCMCVDNRCNEWKALTKQFEDRGASVDKFIVGKGHTLPREIYNRIDDPSLQIPPGTNYSGNAYHCYKAHRQMITDARDAGLKNILLLEDDCLLTPEFDEVFEQATNEIERLNLPWDFLTLGQNLTWGKTEQISEHVVRLVGGNYCWHSICLSQKYHDIFNLLLNMPEIGPFDYIWAHYIQTMPEIHSYGIFPSIALQKPGMSYVQGSMQDYTHYFDNKGLQA